MAYRGQWEPQRPLAGGFSGGGIDSAASEDETVLRAVAGDPDAFVALFGRFFHPIYRTILYRVGNPVEAEDLAQETFERAWAAIGRYRKHEAPFYAWLSTIAHNLVVDWYRRRRHRVTWEFNDTTLTSGRGDPNVTDSVAARVCDAELVRWALGQLKPEYQRVVTMRFLEDKDYHEIAARLGKKEGNVRVLIHRALRELRRKLLERDEGV